jgi:hypothetical protein
MSNVEEKEYQKQNNILEHRVNLAKFFLVIFWDLK